MAIRIVIEFDPATGKFHMESAVDHVTALGVLDMAKHSVHGQMSAPPQQAARVVGASVIPNLMPLNGKKVG